MLGIILFVVALGAGAYWLLRVRKATALHGSLATQVASLAEMVKQLRETQWQIRTAVDSLREEQDFKSQLLAPPAPIA